MVRNRQKKSTVGRFTEEKALTQTNIIVGFKKTGIFPLDEHIFDECDFYPVWSLINLMMHQQALDIWKKTKASTMLIFSGKI